MPSKAFVPMLTVNKYFAAFALVLPITSVLIFPSIQGTTPGYLFALMAIYIVPIISKEKGLLYLTNILYVILIFIILNLIAQLNLAISMSISNISFAGSAIRLVDPTDVDTVLFRKTMFTQSLYLIASISTFCLVKRYYNYKWDKYIFGGALILALYGFYECLFFFIFQKNGDFLSNRTFGLGELGSGSLFQTMSIGNTMVQRLKSLTGEPSMYAFTVLPYCIYSLHSSKFFISTILFLTLLMSTSTTAILGIIIYLFCRIYYYGIKDKIVIFVISLLLISMTISYSYFKDIIDVLVIDKLTLKNISGIDRFDSFISGISFMTDQSTLTQLLGVGFGYVRSTDMFTTLLVNDGIIGLLIFTFLFFIPVFKLSNNNINIGLKSSIIVIFFTMLISVPEFGYLSTWLFLGIAYNNISSAERVLTPLPSASRYEPKYD